MSKQIAQLTTEDLYTLRDALIHAVQARSKDADPTLQQKYEALFRKLGAILAEEQRSA